MQNEKEQKASIILCSSKNKFKVLVINLLKRNLDSFTGESSQTFKKQITPLLENRKGEILPN